MEAAAKVSSEEDRFIRIRGGKIANYYIVRITNSCTGKALRQDDGLLMTGKDDPTHHGVGMRSMRRTLSRLGGSFAYEQTDDSFTLSISLPQNTGNTSTQT